MAYRIPPTRPRLEDIGSDAWLRNRGLDPHEVAIKVGENPDEPLVSKNRLAKDLNMAKTSLYRLLEQLKRERGAQQ